MNKPQNQNQSHRKVRAPKRFITVLLVALFVVSIVAPSIKNAASTVYFADGYESADYSHWTNHEACSITTVNPHSGEYCSITQGGTNGACDINLDTEFTELNVSAWVLFLEYPTWGQTNNQLLIMNTNNFTMIAALGLYPTYEGSSIYAWSIGFTDGFWGHNSGDSVYHVNPALNVWHYIVLRVKCGAANAEYQAWVDGDELADINMTSKNSVVAGANHLEIGDSMFKQCYDDIAISSALPASDPTATPTPTPTPTPSPTPTQTPTPTPSPTASPTATPTATVIPTPTPTATPISGSGFSAVYVYAIVAIVIIILIAIVAYAYAKRRKKPQK